MKELKRELRDLLFIHARSGIRRGRGHMKFSMHIEDEVRDVVWIALCLPTRREVDRALYDAKLVCMADYVVEHVRSVL
jgi:hypothetical protein